jgi:hypothetical protein
MVKGIHIYMIYNLICFKSTLWHMNGEMCSLVLYNIIQNGTSNHLKLFQNICGIIERTYILYTAY